MFFLKLISPKHVPRKKTNWKFRHKFYYAMLKMYLRLYSRGVIEDRIVVNEVVALHTLRDVWFENELRRFGIKITPSLDTINKESFKQRKYHRYHTFNWEDKLTVVHFGKDCSVTRNNSVIFDSDMGGLLRTSTNSEPILSIFYNGYRKGKKPTETIVERRTPPQNKPEKPLAPTTQPKKKKIHIKDTVKPVQESPRMEKPVKAPPQDTYIKHVGFEENDIF